MPISYFKEGYKSYEIGLLVVPPTFFISREATFLSFRRTKDMRNRKDRRGQNIAVHVTGRVWKGLPFIPWRSMRLVLLGIMARAQDLYPVAINHFLFMGNHLHAILSGDPCQISPFMNYLAGEIANAMVRICGESYRGRFWQGRFREQRLCTSQDVLKMISYLYLNPVRAGLVAEHENYPGLSSWQMFSSGSLEIDCPRIPTSVLKAFPDRCTVRSDYELFKKLKVKAKGTYRLCLTPYAWKRCFSDTCSLANESIRQSIMEWIACERKETVRAKSFIGAKALFSRSLRKEYRPAKKTRTPFLICHLKELRAELIADYRAFCDACREAWKARISGAFNTVFPRGAYQPGCSLVPVFI